MLEFVSTVHDLCAVLGMDFFSTVTEVHPSLNDSTGVQSKSISNDTLSSLSQTVLVLKEDKKQRLHKVSHCIVCLCTYILHVYSADWTKFNLFFLSVASRASFAVN